MTPPTEVIVAPLVRDRRRLLGDLVTLTKPRVVLMIVVTTLVGYYVGLTGAPDWTRLLHPAIGTVLAAGGTLALNQYWERDVDARMERTRTRPLPDGRLMPLEALTFGGAITALGIVYLAAFVGMAPAAVTFATFVLYLFAYTPLKLRTALCTIIGAVPGALPPVTGWVAARDDAGAGAWILFGILFLWQLPVIDPEGTSTERQILTGCLALLGVSLLPTLIGLAGVVYFVGALALGLGFVMLGVRQVLAPSVDGARRVLFASRRA